MVEILKGGAHHSHTDNARSAIKSKDSKPYRAKFVGFRVMTEERNEQNKPRFSRAQSYDNQPRK